GKLPDDKTGVITKVGCRYEKFDFSAHPSQSELIKAIKKWSPKEVFMVHGDKDAMKSFSTKILNETGIKATALQADKKTEFS
ncbi:MAG: MBL fold metallo-hydrolase RNA specificity domain-containing protein, partial [archaeon]